MSDEGTKTIKSHAKGQTNERLQYQTKKNIQKRDFTTSYERSYERAVDKPSCIGTHKSLQCQIKAVDDKPPY